MFELVVFTAGEQDYADSVLDMIDADRNIIKHRLYRQHCVRPETGVYVKELSIIKDRNIKNIMLVDNSIISFAFNISNGIPIKAFVGGKNDEELLFMVTYLEDLFSKQDVRPHIKSTFRLQEFTEKYALNAVSTSKREERNLIKTAQESLFVKNGTEAQ